MATLKEIAQEVGCSATTVSLAIRGSSPKVSESVRKQILKTAEKLSYVPHLAAKQLVRGKSGLIGIYMPAMGHNEVWVSLAEELLQRLNDNQYKPILGVGPNIDNIAATNSWLQTFVQLNIEALIVMAQTIEEVKIPHRLNSKFPLWIGIWPPEKPVQSNYIALDRIHAARMAVEHLLSKGRKNILVATIGTKRHSEIAKFVNSHGAEVEFYDYSIYIKQSNKKSKSEITEEHIHVATKLTEYITSKSTKPDACFLGDSPTAVIFINYLISKGIKVPDDIAVVGYDYTPMAKTAMVPLTTVEQPIDIIIDEAVDSIFTILQDDQKQVARQKIIQHRLVERQST